MGGESNSARLCLSLSLSAYPDTCRLTRRPRQEKQKVASWDLVEVVKAKTAEACLSQSAALRNFTGLLLKAPEHTWGLHVSTFGNYTSSGFMNSDFKRLRRAKADFVVDFEREWSDQRRIAIEAPLEALAIDKTDPIAAQLHTRIQDEFLILDSAGPLRPNTKTGWSPSAKKSFESSCQAVLF